MAAGFLIMGAASFCASDADARLTQLVLEPILLPLPRCSSRGARLGFEFARVSGSHHIFTHPDISELLNLQEVRGEAKPYQIRQFLRLVERYNLKLREE